ncbi:hypothetical protein PC128_g11811 [Phytophthora cactorum]|nr:hypothetical protein PC128_g11811 [Phytophthora cactorum]
MLRLWTVSSVLWLAVGHRGWAARTSRRTDNQLVTQSGLKMLRERHVLLSRRYGPVLEQVLYPRRYD